MKTSDAFVADLCAFRQKYPMVYIEAWTPTDFELSVALIGDPEDIEEWDCPKHLLIVDFINKNFSASRGTNWDALADAFRNLKLLRVAQEISPI